MKIEILGAAQTVTGSKHLLNCGETNILIDCGLYQGPDAAQFNKEIAKVIKRKNIDAVILTHAHLDHSGYLPKLYQLGFRGRIFCTKTTREIAKVILNDNAYIQEKNTGKGEIALYTKEDVAKLDPLFSVKKLEDPFVFQGITITFREAGHVLGAVSPIIEYRETRVQFSGDLGTTRDPIHFSPRPLADNLNALVMESTYAGRKHSPELPEEAFQRIIKKCHNQKGTLLIPAFSFGRTQIFLHFLHKFFTENPALELPVYVDSPMGQQITEIYERHTDQHNLSENEIKKIIKRFHFIKYLSEKEKLSKDTSPKIILTASGMLTGGRIIEHLKQYIGDSCHQVLITGYQAEETLGHQLLNGASEVTLEGEVFLVKAQVVPFLFFSAHADQNEMLDWLNRTGVKQIILVHGEKSFQQKFADEIQNLGTYSVKIPVLNDVLRID